MNSIVDIEIDVPREELAALYADPRRMTEWMTDLERYDHIGGEFGTPGSTYRMVTKGGANMVFIVTMTSVELPDQFALKLDSPGLTIFMLNRFTAVSARRTRLVSKQVFAFRGLLSRIAGVFAIGKIRRNHRRHMEGLKRFAESCA